MFHIWNKCAAFVTQYIRFPFSISGSFYIPALIMVYVYWRIFAVARKRQAVLMQGADGAKNKENQGGSDSNSSTLGDNADNQRILKDNIQLDAAGIEETALPLSRVIFIVFCFSIWLVNYL